MNEIENVPVKPLGYRVIVLPDKAPDEVKTKSGLTLVQEGDRKITTGKIVEFSEEVHQDYFPTLQVGTRIVYSPWSGFRITLGRASYLILSVDEILCVIDKEGVEIHAE